VRTAARPADEAFYSHDYYPGPEPPQPVTSSRHSKGSRQSRRKETSKGSAAKPSRCALSSAGSLVADVHAEGPTDLPPEDEGVDEGDDASVQEVMDMAQSLYAAGSRPGQSSSHSVAYKDGTH